MTADQRELMQGIARSAVAVDADDLAARIVIAGLAAGDVELAVWALRAGPIVEAMRRARAKRDLEQDVDHKS